MANNKIDSKALCDITNDIDIHNVSHTQFFDILDYLLTNSINRGRMTLAMQKIVNGMEKENLTTFSENWPDPKRLLSSHSTK